MSSETSVTVTDCKILLNRAVYEVALFSSEILSTFVRKDVDSNKMLYALAIVLIAFLVAGGSGLLEYASLSPNTPMQRPSCTSRFTARRTTND